VLPPGESRWVCAARRIKVRKKDGTDRRTDGRKTVSLYAFLLHCESSTGVYHWRWWRALTTNHWLMIITCWSILLLATTTAVCGFQRRCVSVCFFLHDIPETSAARIAKRDQRRALETHLFAFSTTHREHLFWGQRSRSRVTVNIDGVGFALFSVFWMLASFSCCCCCCYRDGRHVRLREF